MGCVAGCAGGRGICTVKQRPPVRSLGVMAWRERAPDGAAGGATSARASSVPTTGQEDVGCLQAARGRGTRLRRSSDLRGHRQQRRPGEGHRPSRPTRRPPWQRGGSARADLAVRPVLTGAVRVPALGRTWTCARCGSDGPLHRASWRRPDEEPLWFYDLHTAVRDLSENNDDQAAGASSLPDATLSRPAGTCGSGAGTLVPTTA